MTTDSPRLGRMTTDARTLVRATRQALGVSVEDFGRRLGVSARTVENWEQGRNAPHPAILRAILRLSLSLQKSSRRAAKSRETA